VRGIPLAILKSAKEAGETMGGGPSGTAYPGLVFHYSSRLKSREARMAHFRVGGMLSLRGQGPVPHRPAARTVIEPMVDQALRAVRT
jgi:hypothetical protein